MAKRTNQNQQYYINIMYITYVYILLYAS